MKKTLFFGHFWCFLPIYGKMRIFLNNSSLSVFDYFKPLTSCKKSEKSTKWFLSKTENRQMERWKDRWTD